MAEIIERMLKPLMEIYETAIPKDSAGQEAGGGSRPGAIGDQALPRPHRLPCRRRGAARHELSNFAINLEHVGDAISKTLLKLAETRRDQKLQFSPEGWRELNELHHRVMAPCSWRSTCW